MNLENPLSTELLGAVCFLERTDPGLLCVPREQYSLPSCHSLWAQPLHWAVSSWGQGLLLTCHCQPCPWHRSQPRFGTWGMFADWLHECFHTVPTASLGRKTWEPMQRWCQWGQPREASKMRSRWQRKSLGISRAYSDRRQTNRFEMAVFTKIRKLLEEKKKGLGQLSFAGQRWPLSSSPQTAR